ncbi:MAG: hypothetical protein GXX79_18200 [Actinomycetales bacterium]|nr:hypothetical protein [Actinomycetales bacterium]
MTSDPTGSPMGEFLTPPRHRGLVVTLTLAVIGALVLALVVWAPWGSAPEARPSVSSSPGRSTTTPESPTTPTGSSSTAGRRVLVRDDLPAGTSPVALPRGRTQVGAIRTGYPRTTRGAVAAAIEYARFLGPLDEASAAAFTRAAVDPNWSQGAETIRLGVRNSRAWLGASADGDLPAGVSLTVAPMAFQLAPDTPLASPGRSSNRHVTQVRVLILAFMTGTGPAVDSVTQVAVLPIDLCWSHGDWKIAAATSTDSYARLAARPGTPEAVNQGWREYLA